MGKHSEDGASIDVRDLNERALWTLVQTAAGLGVAYVADIDLWWAVAIAGALSALKTFALAKLQ